MRVLPIAALLLVPAAAHGAESAYTTVVFEKDCKQTDTDELGGSAICKGYKDFPVHFSEGDLRQSVFYGHIGSWYEDGAFESFGRFNHAGDRIEWRLEGGSPYATIRRWFVSTGENDEGEPLPEAQVLVISKVGQKGVGDACVVGYVEATANPDANDIARKVADETAKGFECRKAEPAWHGVRKNMEISEMRSFGE